MADSAGGSDRARERLPTIVDVATQAGVSIATVSRVVTGAGRVREAVMTTPALTTVYQPVEDLAKLAVRTLTNPTAERPSDQRMPTRLVVRASSAA